MCQEAVTIAPLLRGWHYAEKRVGNVYSDDFRIFPVKMLHRIHTVVTVEGDIAVLLVICVARGVCPG